MREVFKDFSSACGRQKNEAAARLELVGASVALFGFLIHLASFGCLLLSLTQKPNLRQALMTTMSLARVDCSMLKKCRQCSLTS
jgi:hypothetical protein